jgi:hypothetical protein
MLMNILVQASGGISSPIEKSVSQGLITTDNK